MPSAKMSAREYMNRRYGSAYTEPLDKWVEWTKGTAKPLKSEGTFDLQVWQTFLHDYGPLLCSEGMWRIACTWESRKGKRKRQFQKSWQSGTNHMLQL